MSPPDPAPPPPLERGSCVRGLDFAYFLAKIFSFKRGANDHFSNPLDRLIPKLSFSFFFGFWLLVPMSVQWPDRRAPDPWGGGGLEKKG